MQMFKLFLRISKPIKYCKFAVGVILIYIIMNIVISGYRLQEADVIPPNKVNVFSVKALRRLVEAENNYTLAQTRAGNKNTFAYGFYAVTTSHLIAALLNIRRLKEMKAAAVEGMKEVDFVILTNIELPERIVLSPDIKLKRYPQLPSSSGYYYGSMVKLLIFKMTEYKRIIFMDIDALVLKPLDELFDLPASVSFASPAAYWENELCFTSALLVIKPNNNTWLQIFKKMDHVVGNSKYDMDLLNEMYDRRITISFKLYPEVLLLPGYFLILSSHLREEEQNYYREAGAIFKDVEELIHKTYIVHFSGQEKPWDIERESILSYKSISLYFYEVNLAFKEEYDAIQTVLGTNTTTIDISLYVIFV